MAGTGAESTMILSYEEGGITGEKLLEFARIIPANAVVEVWTVDHPDARYTSYDKRKLTKMKATWGEKTGG